MLKDYRHWKIFTLLLAGFFVLQGCAETRLIAHMAKPGDTTPKKSTYKVGKPYQVDGVWYYPAEDYNYSETGIASWYGQDFHGKPTANGEVFDMNDVSAAHKTLPMPSLVRVTNLDNGRSLLVKVNDRGPFVHGRIIDLSKRAAQLLGFEGKGTAKVRVEIMADESRMLAMGREPAEEAGQTAPAAEAAPRMTVASEDLAPPPGVKAANGQAPRPYTPPPPEPRGGKVESLDLKNQKVKEEEVKGDNSLYIQAGAFSNYDNANKTKARLSSLGNVNLTQAKVKGQDVYRVRVGPVASLTDADQLLGSIIKTGFSDARIVVE